MRPVVVNQYAVIIISVVGVAPEVLAFFNNQAFFSMLRAEPFSSGEPCKTSADDEVIKNRGHRMAGEEALNPKF